MDLFPLPVPALALAAVAVVAAFILVGYAARRTMAQPVSLALNDEVTVLVGVLARPERLPYLSTLAPADFAAAANGRIWAALLAVCTSELSGLGDDPTDEDCARVGAVLAERGEDLHADLGAHLASSPTRAADLQRLTYLSATSARGVPTDDEVSEAAAAVLVTGNDRSRLSGIAPVVASMDPDSVDPQRPPLVRFFVRPSRFRRVLATAALAAVGALIPGFAAQAGLHGAGLWLGCVALAVLAAGSLVLSLVDLDTMYVDLRAFVVTAVGAWALTIAAVGAQGQWSRLIAGIVVVAAAAVIFELANRVYRWRRGVDGQGFGDTLIILATAGVPPALTGDPMLGYCSVMAGLVAGVLGWVVAMLTGRATRSTPIAFGPYLAVGWVLGWVAYLLVG